MSDSLGILGALLPASFGGVDFQMPDSRLTAGRRVQRFLYPGRDDRTYEDLGVMDGPIQVTGFVIGDDYVDQAEDMRQAMRTPGPTTLVHPWLGELLVILVDPGTISYAAHELRVARFDFSVEMFTPDTPAPADTLGDVQDALTDLGTQVQGLLGAVLAPVQLTLGAIGQVQSVCDQVAGIVLGAVGDVGDIVSAVQASVAGLEAVALVPLGLGYASGVATLLAAPGQATVAASAILAPSAIGPGDQAVLAVPLDARLTTTMLISAAGQVTALSVPAPGGALVLSAASLLVSSAVDAASDIVFSSQQEAAGWLVQILGSIDVVANLAVGLAPTMPLAAGQLWNSLQRLRAAVAADINAQIGRLPVVQTYTLQATTPAWLVAQALVGDTPGQVLAMYGDLVGRNRVVHPAMMFPGQIEALVA